MNELNQKLRDAVRHFWEVRERQSQRQGLRTGQRDRGARSAVTGGAQMDGFVDLVKDVIVESGIPETAVHRKTRLELPGFYRPEKQWDLLVVTDNNLLAGIEFKSQIGPSFGNNFNNRTEEALGNATDLWAAYREGAFRTSQRPWLGYLMLLEEAPQSTSPVGTREPHFPIFEEFRAASYAKRYEILLTKLVRERLYDASCLILADRTEGPQGVFHEPSPEISFQNFVASLLARVIAYVRTQA